MSPADTGRARRVLMVAATPYFGDRGCHVRIQGQVQALERLGCEVTIVTYGIGRDVPGGRIVRAPALPLYRALDAAPRLAKLPADLLLLLTARRLGRDLAPDVIHAHTQEGGAIGLLLGRELGRPVVVDLQSRRVAEELVDYGWTRDGGVLFRIADRFDRAIPRAAAAVVASTEEIARFVREQAAPDGPVEVLADAVAVPPEPPRPDPGLLRSLRLDPAAPVIVYLGLLTESQGIDLLLAAAARVRRHRPDLQLLVMGYPELARWQERACSLGLDGVARFTGRMPFEQAPRHVALGHLAVSAKRRTTEGNGKLLLYMACGVATLALDTPTNRAILGPEGLYAADDADAFAAAMIRALADPADRARRAVALFERVRREGSWEERGRRLLDLYRRLGACRKAA